MSLKKLSVFLLAGVLSSPIFADDCFVIGFHDLHSHTYNGPTFCDHVQLKNITVYGPLEVTTSDITGNIVVSGPIQASHSKLGMIEIKKQWTSQKMRLSNDSMVTGNITFDGKAGRVDLSRDSKISGKVINGKVYPIA